MSLVGTSSVSIRFCRTIPAASWPWISTTKAYASIGYQIKADTETPLTKDLVYDGKSFYPVFCQDLKNAEKEILIVSPFMTKSRLLKLVKVLSEPILRGVSVKAVVRPAEDLPVRDRKSVPDNAEYLLDYGIQVVFRPGFHQKFTVIDGTISWYGSVNILSFGKSEESVMRLESREIAGGADRHGNKGRV